MLVDAAVFADKITVVKERPADRGGGRYTVQERLIALTARFRDRPPRVAAARAPARAVGLRARPGVTPARVKRVDRHHQADTQDAPGRSTRTLAPHRFPRELSRASGRPSPPGSRICVSVALLPLGLPAIDPSVGRARAVPQQRAWSETASRSADTPCPNGAPVDGRNTDPHEATNEDINGTNVFVELRWLHCFVMDP